KASSLQQTLGGTLVCRLMVRRESCAPRSVLLDIPVSWAHDFCGNVALCLRQKCRSGAPLTRPLASRTGSPDTVLATLCHENSTARRRFIRRTWTASGARDGCLPVIAARSLNQAITSSSEWT